MDVPQIEQIPAQDGAAQAALLELNNAHARETSFLTTAAWCELVGQAFAATCMAEAAALLIAFDQEADYHSPNFAWFRDRLTRFVYVDRIIVSADHRGRGLAGHLYHDLFRRAEAARHDRIVCEVNLVPPNPGSDAFHASMGFVEVGQADLQDRNKTVRYLEKRL